MTDVSQSKTDTFLSRLETRLHEYKVDMAQADIYFEDYVKNRKTPHTNPIDQAKMKTVERLLEIQYDAAMRIVDEVTDFFSRDR
jgi:hypothetical protein